MASKINCILNWNDWTNVFRRKIIWLPINCRKTHFNAKIAKIHGILMKTFGVSTSTRLCNLSSITHLSLLKRIYELTKTQKSTKSFSNKTFYWNKQYICDWRQKNWKFFCVRPNTHVKFEDASCLYKAITRSKFGHVCDENYRRYRILVQIIT